MCLKKYAKHVLIEAAINKDDVVDIVVKMLWTRLKLWIQHFIEIKSIIKSKLISLSMASWVNQFCKSKTD